MVKCGKFPGMPNRPMSAPSIGDGTVWVWQDVVKYGKCCKCCKIIVNIVKCGKNVVKYCKMSGWQILRGGGVP